MDAVKAALKGVSGYFWIGLRQNPKQTIRSWIWSDGSNSSYRDWYPGEPNGAVGDNCVHLWSGSGYRWNDVGCIWTDPFICYEEKLVLIKEKKTWREALRYCRENHVDLVSVHTEGIQRWVETVARNASTDNVWVGLRHTCAQGFWFWVSGSAICYQNWAPGNGTGVEDCSNGERSGAVQSGSKQWISLLENQTLNFICTTSQSEIRTSVIFILDLCSHTEPVLNPDFLFLFFQICERRFRHIINILRSTSCTAQ
ncbi:macrophage mannose receptor 1-like [Astyanax mexicanus]|uniref:Macrophage mannose receptor 1-like n=1 Tax=Astyanax mexicanus TaxID=7994 RepID=A0A8T2LR21_ASTMX|nr:macrophage mannose receptor 1-like [Astyanax mexicanus]